MVNEVPRWTNAKMEMSWSNELNPIMHDVEGSTLRYYPNVFPHHGSIWNYGALPQTWECPLIKDKTTGFYGDNDPVDVLEIGFKVAKVGEVRQVKLLGTVGLVDQGFTDWKVLAIDVTDPLADNVDDISDMEKSFHGMIEATVHWFTVYKLIDGKPENVFVFGGKPQNSDFAHNLVKLSHKYWKVLIAGKVKVRSMQCTNMTVKKSPFRISVPEAEKIVQTSGEVGPPGEQPAHAYSWFYAELIRRQIRSGPAGTSYGSVKTSSDTQRQELSYMKQDSRAGIRPTVSRNPLTASGKNPQRSRDSSVNKASSL